MKKLLPILALLTLIFSSAACSRRQQSESKQTEADSLINAAFDAKDYERVLTLCDSLLQRGDIHYRRNGIELLVVKHHMSAAARRHLGDQSC